MRRTALQVKMLDENGKGEESPQMVEAPGSTSQVRRCLEGWRPSEDVSPCAFSAFALWQRHEPARRF